MASLPISTINLPINWIAESDDCGLGRIEFGNAPAQAVAHLPA
jgi:hypothetical protein